jgi:hypothetical protein
MTTSDRTHARDNKTGGNLWIWLLVFTLSTVILIAVNDIPLWGVIMAGIGEASSGLAIFESLVNFVFRKSKTPWGMRMAKWDTEDSTGALEWDDVLSLQVGETTIAINVSTHGLPMDLHTTKAEIRIIEAESLRKFVWFRIRRFRTRESIWIRQPRRYRRNLWHLWRFIVGVLRPSTRWDIWPRGHEPLSILRAVRVDGAIVPEGAEVHLTRKAEWSRIWHVVCTLPRNYDGECYVPANEAITFHLRVKADSEWIGKLGIRAVTDKRRHEVWREVRISNEGKNG